MENSQFDIDKHIKHWRESSDDDFNTMLVLFRSKKYNWALFGTIIRKNFML